MGEMKDRLCSSEFWQ